MKIKAVDNLGYVVSVNKTNRSHAVNPEKRSDKDSLELSKEAKDMNKMNASLSPERLALIRQRIAENFYDQDEILTDVADRMLKSNIFQSFLKNNSSDNNS